ncbi:uncharacterized protein N0V89_004908 [Didymosphaeria variabile]|uniref:Uncharacterized protein n=1 Tax=Didymosphaeria variabile TaxID=1932322 RepID=A0A9W9CAQ1_9PLEO|nr:uncharacterized protein N0V89_004908 [Didymosphaeria variabile]KAJ4353182.1 hypothetical protein N0V89_004908 [Didymosphaeria variabile]
MASVPELSDDVKWLICAELYRDNVEFVRPLWRVSRAWRAVAERFVYRGLVLTHVTDDILKEDARKLRNHQFAKKYMEHGRYLHITRTQRLSGGEGIMNHAEQLQTGIKRIPPSFSLTESVTTSPTRDDLFGDKDPWTRAQILWEPIVTLLPDFKHLTDVVVQVRGRLPAGIVAALEQSHPECRLHLRNFTFQSLHEDVTDPDERALATSSNLHSLSIQYMFRDSPGKDDHNEAAALRTVALAPNLKHVTMLASARPRGRPVQLWKGFMPPIDEPDGSKSRLESLAFTGRRSQLTAAKLSKWQEAADLSALRMLSCSISYPYPPRLGSMNNAFPSLTDLTLTVELPPRNRHHDWDHAVHDFLSSLNSLTCLSLSANLSGALTSAIAERHGGTLEKLSLRHLCDRNLPRWGYSISANDLSILASACLQLTEFSLIMQRSMGDRTEIECYEAIGMYALHPDISLLLNHANVTMSTKGSFRKLKYVKLDLACWNSRGSFLQVDPNWDDFEKAEPDNGGDIDAPRYNRCRNGHLKCAIVNSALDETLARSIYALISSKRSESPLDVLEIKTYGGGSPCGGCPDDLGIIVKHVSRSYRVEKASGRRGAGFINVIELSKEEREVSDARVRASERNYAKIHGKGSKAGQGGVWAMFRHLWPFEDHEDWRGVWQSWPLGYQKA